MGLEQRDNLQGGGWSLWDSDTYKNGRDELDPAGRTLGICKGPDPGGIL
jgi:hypothetical protein